MTAPLTLTPHPRAGIAPSPTAQEIAALHEEVRALARERGGVILAHNYQRPEVQDAADFVGDSLALSRRATESERELIATETGMLYPLQEQNPDKRFIPVRRAAICQYMKMITLENLRDSLRQMRYEVRVPPDIAARARVPIERMVAIT